jgi:hypothetical protein
MKMDENREVRNKPFPKPENLFTVLRELIFEMRYKKAFFEQLA